MTEVTTSNGSIYFRMPARPGSHTIYVKDGNLIVDWYDFGGHVPYESANLLVFEPREQAKLGSSLEMDALEPLALAKLVAERFDSYFEVQEFAQSKGISFSKLVDFQP